MGSGALLLAEERTWAAPGAVVGYFPVDARTPHGAFGGPGAHAVRSYDRVLGYGRWGSEVLRAVTGQATPYLPHGIHIRQWQQVREDDYENARARLGRRVTDDTVLIGCVAANQ